MQPTSGTGSGNGSAEFGRRGGGGGLVRYRSAPATWLEALLESEDEQSDILSELREKPSNIDSDLEFLETPAASGGLSSFLRQNSSPAEFFSLISNSDGYFSSLGIPADYVSPPTAKRAREAEDLDTFSREFSSSTRVKREEGMNGSFDIEMEKLLEDSVMFRTRAKRGCATHPRSIAERVRRTKISDRMRLLQELVPNMDKQTNTADMLDEAVEYVKFLQKQIQELTEDQKNCKCLEED